LYVNFWNSLSLCCFHPLQYIFNIFDIFGFRFIILYISFLFLFEASISFIFRIDSLATRETIIAVLFCLFSSFYCFSSRAPRTHTHIWIAVLSWFYFAVLVSVLQEPQKGETRGLRILWVFDVDQPRNTSKDPLHVPNGPMTRSKTKAMKEALNALVLNVSTKSKLKGPLEYQEETLIHLIHV
jgi:hypothetical protein